MTFESSRLKLPYIAPAQAQKHVTHNEALRRLDALVQPSVIDQTQTTPPLTPVEGEGHIIGPAAINDWTGKTGQIAVFQDGAWAYFTPGPGWQSWVETAQAFYVWDGAAWGQASADLTNIDTQTIGINASADVTNRLSVSAPASLFNHEGGGHQVKLNKNAATDTASFLFQTGFGGRAEIGLTGDDDFHFKVSPDGVSWNNALIIDKDTGAVGVGALPATGSDFEITNTTTHASFRLSQSVTGHSWEIKNSAGSGRLTFGTVGGSKPFKFDPLAISNLFTVGTSATNQVDIGGVLALKTYTVATLPTPVTGGLIFVSDEINGAVIAFGDGTNWRRMTDRIIVS